MIFEIVLHRENKKTDQTEVAEVSSPQKEKKDNKIKN